MSLLATVNGRGTLAARPAAAAANEGYIYSASDAALYRSNGASWDTIGGSGIADQGTFTYLDGTVAAAPATPAAGKLRLYAKTGKVLAVKDDAGVETVLGAGGGGSDLVQVAAGAGSVRIPGLHVADRVPAAPHASDDEFNALSGWTTLGSLNISNVTDVASHWHVVKANAGLQIHGIYKAAPATPFTVTMKLADMLDNGDFTEYGLALGDATPTAWTSVSISKYPGKWTMQRDTWTNNTTRASAANGSGLGSDDGPRYLRLVVASTADVTAFFSSTGLLWRPSGLGTINPGYASQIGIVVSANGVQAEGLVDWIRFS